MPNPSYEDLVDLDHLSLYHDKAKALFATQAGLDALDGRVVVTQRAVPVPERIGGKPVRLVSLNRLWGVALP